MLKALINDKLDLSLNADLTQLIDSGEAIAISKDKVGGFTIVLNGVSYTADVIAIDKENKKATVLVNNHSYQVSIKEPVDQLMDQLGIVKKVSKANNALVSPMPGLILSIAVKVGDTVKKGEQLLILEAMKMENVFKAINDVVIAEICVQEKTAIEKGQILIKFK
jgi:biotin carboxyl carrier protein